MPKSMILKFFDQPTVDVNCRNNDLLHYFSIFNPTVLTQYYFDYDGQSSLLPISYLKYFCLFFRTSSLLQKASESPANRWHLKKQLVVAISIIVMIMDDLTFQWHGNQNWFQKRQDSCLIYYQQNVKSDLEIQPDLLLYYKMIILQYHEIFSG